jgi:hypothetical protein
MAFEPVFMLTAVGHHRGAPIARRIRFVYLSIAVIALIASLLLFLREIFLAVSTPRHVPR